MFISTIRNKNFSRNGGFRVCVCVWLFAGQKYEYSWDGTGATGKGRIRAFRATQRVVCRVWNMSQVFCLFGWTHWRRINKQAAGSNQHIPSNYQQNQNDNNWPGEPNIRFLPTGTGRIDAKDKHRPAATSRAHRCIPAGNSDRFPKRQKPRINISHSKTNGKCRWIASLIVDFSEKPRFYESDESFQPFQCVPLQIVYPIQTAGRSNSFGNVWNVPTIKRPVWFIWKWAE